MDLQGVERRVGAKTRFSDVIDARVLRISPRSVSLTAFELKAPVVFMKSKGGEEKAGLVSGKPASKASRRASREARASREPTSPRLDGTKPDGPADGPAEQQTPLAAVEEGNVLDGASTEAPVVGAGGGDVGGGRGRGVDGVPGGAPAVVRPERRPGGLAC